MTSFSSGRLLVERRVPGFESAGTAAWRRVEAVRLSPRISEALRQRLGEAVRVV